MHDSNSHRRLIAFGLVGALDYVIPVMLGFAIASFASPSQEVAMLVVLIAMGLGTARWTLAHASDYRSTEQSDDR